MVARKQFEHFSPRGRCLITHLYGLFVCVYGYVCGGQYVCVVLREGSCQAELWGCSSIQPSNNNEPLTTLDRAQSPSSPVAITVVIVCKCLYDLFYICAFRHTCICLVLSVFCFNLNIDATTCLNYYCSFGDCRNR